MYIRNYKGQLVKFDITKYYSETELYVALWKIKYNIDISKTTQTSFNKGLLDFISSWLFFLFI